VGKHPPEKGYIKEDKKELQERTYSEANQRLGKETTTLFAWLISHQPAVFFSQNKPATSNQPTILFSQNKSAPAINHQPNEQAEHQLTNREGEKKQTTRSYNA
jgi:hypothetical protein